MRLMLIPKEPWERAEPYYCYRRGVVAGTRQDNRDTYENGKDVCGMSLEFATIDLAAVGHSHPYFTWDDKKTVKQNTVRCGNKKLNTKMAMIEENLSRGTLFSFSDRTFAERLGKPLYLVVSERNFVKVYRRKEGCPSCEWMVENL